MQAAVCFVNEVWLLHSRAPSSPVFVNKGGAPLLLRCPWR